MQDEASCWLQTAESDLDSAQLLLAKGKYAHCAFFLQQATEKAMKALLRELGQVERTHSSVEMMSRLSRLGIDFPHDFDTPLRKLDKCFTDTRYPNGIGGPPDQFYNRAIAEELLKCCQDVMAFVKSKLS